MACRSNSAVSRQEVMWGSIPLPHDGVSGLEPLLEVRVLGNMFVNRGMYYSANLLANVIRCFFIRGYSKTSVSSGLGHDFKEEISYFH